MNEDYEFVHDQVQEAAYSLLTDSNKKMQHLIIGRTLLASLDGDLEEEQLFKVLGYFNVGLEFIKSEHEKI